MQGTLQTVMFHCEPLVLRQDPRICSYRYDLYIFVLQWCHPSNLSICPKTIPRLLQTSHILGRPKHWRPSEEHNWNRWPPNRCWIADWLFPHTIADWFVCFGTGFLWFSSLPTLHCRGLSAENAHVFSAFGAVHTVDVYSTPNFGPLQFFWGHFFSNWLSSKTWRGALSACQAAAQEALRQLEMEKASNRGVLDEMVLYLY